MTWSLKRIVEKLDDHGITVYVKNGQPAFRRPWGMPDAVFLDIVAQVGVHATKRRVELLVHYQVCCETLAEPPPKDPLVIYRGDPPERVRAVKTAWIFEAQAMYGGRIMGYWRWKDKRERVCTEYLEPGLKSLPAYWTKATVEGIPPPRGWLTLPKSGKLKVYRKRRPKRKNKPVGTETPRLKGVDRPGNLPD